MKTFAKMAFVLALAFGSQFASAVCFQNPSPIPYGTGPLHPVNGLWCTERPIQNGQQQVIAQQQVFVPQQAQQVQLVPVQGNTTQFVNGGNVYHCPALAGWGGGLIGAVLGHKLGRNVTTQGHNLGGLGAVVGAVAGNQIACELVGSQSVSNVQSVNVAAQGVSGVPAATTVVAGRQKPPAPPAGNWTCNFSQNGQITETVMTADDATCRDWTKAVAVYKGLIAAN
jgi:hypothetical protein